MVTFRKLKRIVLFGTVALVVFGMWVSRGSKRRRLEWMGPPFSAEDMRFEGMVICNKQHVKQPRVNDAQTWQDVEDRNTIVFSSYYDADDHLIRVVANSLLEDTRPLYCVMWFEKAGSSWDTREGVISVKAFRDDLPFHHGRPWSAFYYICYLPHTKDIPYAISLAPRSCGTYQSGNSLAVQNTPNTWYQPKVEFGLCLPMIMNHFSDIVTLVETFEMHRILGVEKVVVYNVSMTASVENLIRDYQREGFVDVVQWNIMDKLNTWTHPGTPKDPNIQIHYAGQVSCMNDCLNRYKLYICQTYGRCKIRYNHISKKKTKKALNYIAQFWLS